MEIRLFFSLHSWKYLLWCPQLAQALSSHHVFFSPLFPSVKYSGYLIVVLLSPSTHSAGLRCHSLSHWTHCHCQIDTVKWNRGFWSDKWWHCGCNCLSSERKGPRLAAPPRDIRQQAESKVSPLMLHQDWHLEVMLNFDLIGKIHCRHQAWWVKDGVPATENISCLSFQQVYTACQKQWLLEENCSAVKWLVG